MFFVGAVPMIRCDVCVVTRFVVFESGKVPFLGLSTLGWYRDLYMPSSALFINLYVLVDLL